MATIHSLNIAMGLDVSKLSEGAREALSVVSDIRRKIEQENSIAVQKSEKSSSSMLDSTIKAVATYHALRVTIFSVASAAELISEHMQRSAHATEGMKHAASAVASTFHEASKSMHHLIAQGVKAVASFATGDTSHLPRSARADAAAESAAEDLANLREQWKKKQALDKASVDLRKRMEEEGFDAMERMRMQKERAFQAFRDQLFADSLPKTMGAYEKQVEIMFRSLQQDKIPTYIDEFQREIAIARAFDARRAMEDMQSEIEQLQQRKEEEDAQFDAYKERQRMDAERAHAGGGAFALGSVQEYQARLRAMQAGEGSSEESKHRRKVESLLERIASLQQQMAQLQKDAPGLSIPGAA